MVSSVGCAFWDVHLTILQIWLLFKGTRIITCFSRTLCSSKAAFRSDMQSDSPSLLLVRVSWSAFRSRVVFPCSTANERFKINNGLSFYVEIPSIRSVGMYKHPIHTLHTFLFEGISVASDPPNMISQEVNAWFIDKPSLLWCWWPKDHIKN